MIKFQRIVIGVIVLAVLLPAQKKSYWTLEAFLGSAKSIASPLSIHQYGEERISLIARYNTRPFVGSPYYSYRISKWSQNRAWEFELVHHKLYLSNPPDEVQQFNISHGYNLITVNRAWLRRGFIMRVGAGIVATHPETTIRGKTLLWEKGFDGFYISGITLQVAAGKKFTIWGKFFGVLEAKFTTSYAVIPIQDGNAYVPNVAFHGLFGLGIEL
jgi:hypothetical protein